MPEGNWWSVLLAAAGSGIVTFWITRMSKNFDARGAAEAALIQMPGPIITEQNRRIAALTEGFERQWQQIQEGHERERKCQEEINTLQDQIRDQRHEIRELQTKVNALERKLGTLRDE